MEKKHVWFPDYKYCYLQTWNTYFHTEEVLGKVFLVKLSCFYWLKFIFSIRIDLEGLLKHFGNCSNANVSIYKANSGVYTLQIIFFFSDVLRNAVKISSNVSGILPIICQLTSTGRRECQRGRECQQTEDIPKRRTFD